MLVLSPLARIVPNALFQPLRWQKHKQITAGPRPVILLPAVLTVCCATGSSTEVLVSKSGRRTLKCGDVLPHCYVAQSSAA
ncbi:hypothetical protein J6590_081782 [Homalodisca vitripennis]|nr:hypothetical protein J6590_081782 [Homalodisca vitripennis]